MEAHALQIPMTEPPLEIRQQFGFEVLEQCYKEELREEVSRGLTREINRVIQEQVMPEAFTATVRAALPNPNPTASPADHTLYCEAKVTVTPEPVPVAGLFEPTLPHIPGQAPILATPTVPENPAAALRGIAEKYLGQPDTPQTLGALDAEVQNVQNNIVAALGVPQDFIAGNATGEVRVSGISQYQPINLTWDTGTISTSVITVGGLRRWVYPNMNEAQTTAAQAAGALRRGEVARYAEASQDGENWYADINQNNNFYNLYQANACATAAYGTYGEYITTSETTGATTAWYAAAPTAITYNYTTDGLSWYAQSIHQETKAEKFKNKIRNQLCGGIRKRQSILEQLAPPGMSTAELKARDTLRDMLSEQDWRRYVTNSFVMVRGESGKWYQVFANHNTERIRVYEKGEHIANLCIHSDSSCPPTDHVIAMKIQIELDEESIWKESNTYDQRGHSAGNITIGAGNGAGGPQVTVEAVETLREMMQTFVAGGQDVPVVNVQNPYAMMAV